MIGAIAASFWSSPVAQIVLAALVGGAVFALGWLMLGTAARARKDREVAARVAAVTGAPRQPVSQASEGTQGWIPDRVTHFGRRFAESRGFQRTVGCRTGGGRGQGPLGRIRGAVGRGVPRRRGARRGDDAEPAPGAADRRHLRVRTHGRAPRGAAQAHASGCANSSPTS